MLCPNCGKANEVSNKYCLSCGKALINSAQPESSAILDDKKTSQKTKGRNLRGLRFLIIPIGILVIILIIVGVYKIINPSPKPELETSQHKCVQTTVYALQEGNASATNTDDVTEQNSGGTNLPAIQSVSEDTGGCLKLVGDTIHFKLGAGEPGGTATVDIGDVHQGIRLFDNGTHGDKTANDGVYEYTYKITSSDVIRSGSITGHFHSKGGKEAPAVKASTMITIVDWSAGSGSVDSDVNYIPDPVTGGLYDPNRVIISFKEGTTSQEIINNLGELNFTLSSWIPQINVVEVALASGQNFEEIRLRLLEDPLVLDVEQNYAMEFLGDPTPVLDNSMPISQNNYLNIIRAKLGWKITKGSPEIGVAIIDSGVYLEHVEFFGQIRDYLYPIVDGPVDFAGHGTFIAGLIAAEQGATGISGIAPGIKLSVYKNSSYPKETNPLLVSLDIIWATDAGNRVINLSICEGAGKAKIFFLHNAINYAYKKKVILIAGVGETGKCGGPQEFFKEDIKEQDSHKVYPASYQEVLAVGSTEIDDSVATYSDFGKEVIYAPVPSRSGGIFSTWNNGRYEHKYGTSFAAPQVAALAALIISVKPKLARDQVIDIIIKTADKKETEKGLVRRINVYRALMVASRWQNPGVGLLSEEKLKAIDPGEDPLPTEVTNLITSVDQNDPPSVYISWTPPSKDNDANRDFEGVYIYREDLQDFSVVQLEGGLIRNDSYTDKYVSYGKSYRYYVFSVDSRGQESINYADSGMIGPKIQPAPSINNNLFSIAMVSAKDGWIVGAKGTILRWDGTSWKAVKSPTVNDLDSVAMVSPTDGWATGKNSTILHWDGQAWIPVDAPPDLYLPSLPYNLSSLVMRNARDGWALKTESLLHWNGVSWTVVPSPITAMLTSASGTPESDFWITSQGGIKGYGLGEIHHWDGRKWHSTMEIFDSTGDRLSLYRLGVISNTDIWGVGTAWTIGRREGFIVPLEISGKENQFFHWDGSSWTLVKNPSKEILGEIRMLSAKDGWAVGHKGTILHWDGKAWINMNSPVTSWLSSVAMVSDTDGWAVGENGTILRWNGSNWVDFNPHSVPSATPLPPVPVPSPTTIPTPTTTLIPPSEFGKISGWRCYPSSGIPPMTIYARNVDTLDTYTLHLSGGGCSEDAFCGNFDASFSMDLPPGNYIFFSWTDPGVNIQSSIGGVYSCFVDTRGNRCDASRKDDHTPIVVAVEPGQVANNIAVCDYYTDQIPPAEIQGKKSIILSTATPAICKNDSNFVLDITIPDNTKISKGNRFIKTWRLLNSGTCDWTPDFQFIFISGDQMSGPLQMKLNKTVHPGETIDLSIELIAPRNAGTYRGQWQLATPNGEPFGTKPYVQIIVP